MKKSVLAFAVVACVAFFSAFVYAGNDDKDNQRDDNRIECCCGDCGCGCGEDCKCDENCNGCAPCRNNEYCRDCEDCHHDGSCCDYYQGRHHRHHHDRHHGHHGGCCRHY